MDETGIGLGICTNSHVLASSKKRKAYKKSPEIREWVSIIETISATGQAPTPLSHLRSTHFRKLYIASWERRTETSLIVLIFP